ncbi:MAG: hypothetical protein ACJAY0_000474 [Thalassolituus sp.]
MSEILTLNPASLVLKATARADCATYECFTNTARYAVVEGVSTSEISSFRGLGVLAPLYLFLGITVHEFTSLENQALFLE